MEKGDSQAVPFFILHSFLSPSFLGATTNSVNTFLIERSPASFKCEDNADIVVAGKLRRIRSHATFVQKTELGFTVRRSRCPRRRGSLWPEREAVVPKKLGKCAVDVDKHRRTERHRRGQRLGHL